MPSLDELDARLTALERVAGEQTGGSISANYITVDPATGQVSADFTGIINALGVTLPAGTAQQDPAAASDQIIWKDTGDGSVVASVQGWTDDINDNLGVRLQSRAKSNGWQNYAIVQALSDPNDPIGHGASLQVSQHNRGAPPPPFTTGGGTEVDVFVGAHSAKILDAAGASSFIGAPDASSNWRVTTDFLSTAYNVGPTAAQLTSFACGALPTKFVVVGHLFGNPVQWSVVGFSGSGGGTTMTLEFSNLNTIGQAGTWFGVILGHD